MFVWCLLHTIHFVPRYLFFLYSLVPQLSYFLVSWSLWHFYLLACPFLMDSFCMSFRYSVWYIYCWDFILICTISATIPVSILRQVSTTIYPLQDRTPIPTMSSLAESTLRPIQFTYVRLFNFSMLYTSITCHLLHFSALYLWQPSTLASAPFVLLGFVFSASLVYQYTLINLFSVDTHRVFRHLVYQISTISSISRLKND